LQLSGQGTIAPSLETSGTGSYALPASSLSLQNLGGFFDPANRPLLNAIMQAFTSRPVLSKLQG
jgi:hypothetical protein